MSEQSYSALIQSIDELFEQGRYSDVRDRIRKNATRFERWYYFMLIGSAYVDERHFAKGVYYFRLSVRSDPRNCVALWNLACGLYCACQYRESVQVFRKLIRGGVRAIIAHDPDTPRDWARVFVMDCHYRIALSLHGDSRTGQAVIHLRKYLQYRRTGLKSRFTLAELRVVLKWMGLSSKLIEQGTKAARLDKSLS
jgi:hypothetical protein